MQNIFKNRNNKTYILPTSTICSMTLERLIFRLEEYGLEVSLGASFTRETEYANTQFFLAQATVIIHKNEIREHSTIRYDAEKGELITSLTEFANVKSAYAKEGMKFLEELKLFRLNMSQTLQTLIKSGIIALPGYSAKERKKD